MNDQHLSLDQVTSALTERSVGAKVDERTSESIEYVYPYALEVIEPRAITLIVIDTRSGKLANATQKTDIKYIDRRSYATWDPLLGTAEECVRLISSSYTLSGLKFVPEYRGVGGSAPKLTCPCID